jgi:hypothetical protein
MKQKSMDFLLSYTMVMKNSKNKKRVRHNHEQNKSKIIPKKRRSGQTEPTATNTVRDMDGGWT